MSFLRSTLPVVQATSQTSTLRLLSQSRPVLSMSANRSAFKRDQSTAAAILSWREYLALRKGKRTFGLIASVPTTFLGFMIGVDRFASLEADPSQLILGIEPVYAYGVATFACVGLGWLSGPVIGNFIWRLLNRSRLAGMEIKDKEFYERIKRLRVDPSRQSVSNPIPDHYGEAIRDFSTFRQWLRDQQSFRRKAEFGGGESL